MSKLDVPMFAKLKIYARPYFEIAVYVFVSSVQFVNACTSMAGWELTQPINSFIWSCTSCWHSVSFVVLQRVILPTCSCHTDVFDIEVNEAKLASSVLSASDFAF